MQSDPGSLRPFLHPLHVEMQDNATDRAATELEQKRRNAGRALFRQGYRQKSPDLKRGTAPNCLQLRSAPAANTRESGEYQPQHLRGRHGSNAKVTVAALPVADVGDPRIGFHAHAHASRSCHGVGVTSWRQGQH